MNPATAILTIVAALNFLLLPAGGGKYDPTTLVFPPFLHIWVQKATSTHLRLYTRNSVKVDNPQGVAATRLASLEDPGREEDDDELTVYGVNSGYDMIIYNTSKSAIAFYGMKQRGEKRLNNPHGITAHSNGDVYLADTGNDRVVHLFNDGRKLEYRTALGGLAAPRDVAISPDQTLYVADTGNNRIAVYRQNRLVQTWGEGQTDEPAAIAATDATDRWSYYKDRFVIVVDSLQQRIQKFTPEGQLLARTTTAGKTKSTAELGFIAIDYYSNVYLTDRANHCIHKLDRNLNYLTCFGRKGSGDKEFDEPRGIAIHKRFGQVIIAEKSSVQYYWVGTDVKDLRAKQRPDRSGIALDYFLTETSYVTLEILDEQENLIATPMKKTLRKPGRNREVLANDWTPVHSVATTADSLAASSHEPQKGRYRLRWKFEPTYSSYTRFEKNVEQELILK